MPPPPPQSLTSPCNNWSPSPFQPILHTAARVKAFLKCKPNPSPSPQIPPAAWEYGPRSLGLTFKPWGILFLLLFSALPPTLSPFHSPHLISCQSPPNPASAPCFLLPPLFAQAVPSARNSLPHPSSSAKSFRSLLSISFSWKPWGPSKFAQGRLLRASTGPVPVPPSVLNTLPCDFPQGRVLAQTSGSVGGGWGCSPLYLVDGARCCLQDEGTAVRPGAGGLGGVDTGLGGRAVAGG